ncbi:hypothetical protein DYE48_15155 [Halobacillus trueperi]|uniref:Uncharacterized protein n=1 Tax=Halobacillus trueperi TaxID=156205 RepID=A0A3E0J4V2_9BACI|nr:hypothetical protein DYE48_15155 [Halobacillus trueperi]
MLTGRVVEENLLEGITIKDPLKYISYYIVSLYIIQIALSLWTEKGIDWATFTGLSIGGVIGIVILDKLKKVFIKDEN